MIMVPKENPGDLWQKIADSVKWPKRKPRVVHNKYGWIGPNAIRQLAKKIERILGKGDK